MDDFLDWFMPAIFIALLVGGAVVFFMLLIDAGPTYECIDKKLYSAHKQYLTDTGKACIPR